MMETRKDKMNHMFALMNEVRRLVGRLRPEDTGHIHTTIGTLNERVDEIKHELSKEDNYETNQRKEEKSKEKTESA